jgi:SOS-response transcriptional repressor LexA
MKENLPKWFYEVLEAAKEKAGSRAALARALDTRHPTIMDWEEGSVPGLDKFLQLLDYAGGDISRALPGYQDEPQRPSIRVYGRVSAGLVTLAQQEERVVEGEDGAWKSSVYRKLTHGPIIYLEVSGNSMEPEYPDGALLACAKPSQRSLPDLTPVIARVDESATFKLYRMSRDRSNRAEVELVPINRSYHIQRFAPSQVAIDYVVLGFINPWKHGVSSEPRMPILRERR